ncbi:hypothetical protein EUX98_g9659 [Antrodiella citrinella]|uniref:C3H1-type domain-containing protein n=1 Tax=Antrodiella citrinella TaxID=2447956 RepID=A0A4S4LPN4_9APHY|nr:hypothetical protein EUX98_g9659 [Antrodiella citrinella]
MAHEHLALNFGEAGAAGAQPPAPRDQEDVPNPATTENGDTGTDGMPATSTHGDTEEQATVIEKSAAVQPVFEMFTDAEAVERVRATALAIAGEQGKKKVLPPIRYGFKSSPLELSVSTRIDNAFAAFDFVPYPVVIGSRALGADNDKSFTLGLDGSITAKGFSMQGQLDMPDSQWRVAASAAEDLTLKHHGAERGRALAAHHRVVENLNHSHGRRIAMEYDVQQRRIVARCNQHDISTLDANALTLIATAQLRTQSASTGVSLATNPPAYAKRNRTEYISDAQPQAAKRPRNSTNSNSAPPLCFRCGITGHLPAACSSTTTSAGRPCARIAPGATSPNSILAANGLQFCYNWARSSSCRFGTECNNHHACSICEDTDHGASACSRRK